ncbi:MAG: methyltransferase domain-containing protein, partial [Deltaproteobacteria bacterium]|nr:methyltransferase domain-containing protein [Deltaproteobacteria bacterium]
CCRIFGRRVRHHSVDRIIEEIGILVDRYGAREINLEADTLTLKKTFVFALCDRLIESGLFRRIAWTCESRVDTVNEEMLGRMRQAGCWQISYGVETGSQRLLDLIHKDITLEQIERVFALTKRTGISIRGFYMLGLPTETRRESLRTIAFARKLDARWSQFTLFTPFPGTELYDLALRDGGLRSRDWADYKTHGGWTEGGIAYVPRGRTLKEMKTLQKRAYRAVYLRPRVFLRFARDIDSPAKFMGYATGFWVLLKTGIQREAAGGKAVRVSGEDLERYAKGVYVDSPVYFARNPVVRALNWAKLDAGLSLLPDTEERREVLDFGCGNGVMLPSLSARYDRVLGIDRHPTAAARMKRNRRLDNVLLLRADGLRLPIRTRVLQGVVALSVLEHFEDLEAAASEIARVLRPGGFLLFLSPTENFFYRIGRALCGYRKPPDHYHPAGEIERVLGGRLEVEQTRNFPFDSLPFLSAYRILLLRKS